MSNTVVDPKVSKELKNRNNTPEDNRKENRVKTLRWLSFIIIGLLGITVGAAYF